MFNLFLIWAKFHFVPRSVGRKSCLRRILLRFLSFRPKIQVFSKKSLYLFSCSDFLTFVRKFRCSLKNSFHLEYLLIYRFQSQMSFSNLMELFFVTFIVARKLEIVAGPQVGHPWIGIIKEIRCVSRVPAIMALHAIGSPSLVRSFLGWDNVWKK